MLKKFFAFAILIFFGALQLEAQNINRSNLTNIIPPSPEVAALGKFVNIPIGYPSGTPVISIPIYTIETGPLQLPISLSYTGSSGIKVAEAASWVGLGWNLSAGGSVSRIVRGLPDDYSITNGYMFTSKTPSYILSLPKESTERYNLLHNQVYDFKTLDVEPDIFMFSVLGYSGKFYFDQEQHKFVLTPYQRIKIEFSGLGGSYPGFLLTLPNGVKCYFGGTVVENSSSMETVTDNNGSLGIGSSGDAPAHITSWLLEKIAAPTGESIDFSYTNQWNDDFGRSGETADYGICGEPNQFGGGHFSASYFKSHTLKPILNKIEWSQGNALFNPSTDYRQDVMGLAPSLQSIEIQNTEQKLIKAYDFEYDYFVSSDNPFAPIASTADIAKKRLYLKNLRERGGIPQGGSAAISNPPYEFYYNTDHILPSRWSTSQDYWGFYNGKDNGNRMTPKVDANLLYGSSSSGSNIGSFFAGADRRVESIYTASCVLNKIKYPTGGTTEYFYESNRVSSSFLSFLNGYILSGLVDKTKFTYKADALSNPLNHNQYIDNLNINEVIGSVQITASFPCSNFNSIDCKVHSKIQGVTDPNFSQSITQTSMFVTLPQGSYKIITTLTPLPDDPPLDFNIRFDWEENPDSKNILVGGLRLQKVVSKDAIGGKLVKSLSYQSFQDGERSSGELINLPVNAFNIPCGSDNYGNVLRLVSNSEAVLSATDGQAIRYTNITEFADEDKSSFKTEYTYSSDHYDYQIPQGTNYPFPTDVQREWRSNLLTGKKQYEKLTNGQHRILTDESYEFINYGTIFKEQFGIRVAPYAYAGSGPTVFGYTPYSFVTEWYLPDNVKTSNYAYNDNGQSSTLSSKTQYYYNNDFALANTKTSNSKGQVLETKTWYPSDYNDLPQTNIAALITSNNVELPIKQESLIDGKIKSGSITEYNALGQPTALFNYENSALITEPAHNRDQIIESGYNSQATLSYQQNKISDIFSDFNKKSYIWDYANTYPVAECVGAFNASLAYTSFESDGTGNWLGISSGNIRLLGGVTGNKYYDQSNFSVSKSGLESATKYIITYWSKNGSYSITGTQSGYPKILNSTTVENVNWTQYEHLVTGQATITINGSGAIDELRLYPQGTLLTTYTYIPLVGINSKCDASGHITNYEYDGFGRLALVRDQDGKILKKICYGYAGQTESCPVGVGNSQKSGIFTKNNCGSGYTGSAVTYIVPANTYFGANADAQAQADIDNYGQAYANEHGICTPVTTTTFSSHAINTNFYSQNCTSGQSPVAYPVNLPLGYFTSTVSQSAADQFADQYAQNQANQFGACNSQTIYARMEVSVSETGDQWGNYDSYYDGTEYSYASKVAIYVRFYSDAACTQRYTLTSNLDCQINNLGSGYYMTSDGGYNQYVGPVYTLTATGGTNEVLVDDSASFEGFWGFLNSGGDWNYYERWRDDYGLASASNCTIATPIYPSHTSGY